MSMRLSQRYSALLFSENIVTITGESLDLIFTNDKLAPFVSCGVYRPGEKINTLHFQLGTSNHNTRYQMTFLAFSHFM